jgi:hypothetical protein
MPRQVRTRSAFWALARWALSSSAERLRLSLTTRCASLVPYRFSDREETLPVFRRRADDEPIVAERALKRLIDVEIHRNGLDRLADAPVQNLAAIRAVRNARKTGAQDYLPKSVIDRDGKTYSPRKRITDAEFSHQVATRCVVWAVISRMPRSSR